MEMKSLRGEIKPEQKAEIAEGNYWTTRQLADQLSFTQLYIQVLCRRGIIKAIRYQSKWRIPKSEVKRLLRDGLKRPPLPQGEIPLEALTLNEEQQKLIEPVKRPWWDKTIQLPF